MDLVDQKLQEHGIVEKDVLQVIHEAFFCLQPLANLRPPMSRIVAQLTCKVETVGTPMRPVFLQRRRRKDNNLSWDFPYLRLFLLLCGPSPLRCVRHKIEVDSIGEMNR
ncbi:hypothetical protein OIU74_029681 [Salix koriyanagi]|uniref:Uncharacterized protein n=1 Tax=Salix koriyanagi TaxID=2511006 RepID=A0A9Q0VEH5_9ROSI|nr:hypothetical protein OIU74_029681 [Salix koriyanagi]